MSSDVTTSLGTEGLSFAAARKNAATLAAAVRIDMNRYCFYADRERSIEKRTEDSF